MSRNSSKRSKIAATLMVMLLTVTFVASLLPEAAAALSPAEIISIDPDSGPVGEAVRINGAIDTTNGSYQILFEGKAVKNGNATGTAVNTTFTVPLSAEGSHNVTLFDVTSGTQSSGTFTVVTSYNVYADPAWVQEGLSTAITVGVNEAEPNKTYTFTIEVTDPQPTPGIHATTITVSTNATGSGSDVMFYPENFTDAATDYVGTYKITVIADDLTFAIGNFTVGLTDRLEYGRTETTPEYEGTRVGVHGSGYDPDELVLINITFAGTALAGEATLTDENGMFIYFWRIPEEAEPGIYTVTLTNGTGVQIKPVPDIQNFTVVELLVKCKTQNEYDQSPLADVTVAAILVPEQAYLLPELVDSGTTNETGLVDLQLDFGNYTFQALWGGKEVCSLENQSVTGNTTTPFILECALASVTVAVTDDSGLPLSFIGLTLTSNKTGPLPLPDTGSTGIVATNAETNTSYRIEAWRYGHLFFNQSIGNLTFSRRINLTCPTLVMSVRAIDSEGLPLQNVQVVVYEWSSERIMESVITDTEGSIALGLTFGRYRVEVCNYSTEWKRLVIFNETIVDLINDQQSVVINCRISNLELSLVVNDYFGQPIPNAQVRIEREFEDEYVNIANLTTKSDGTVLLPKIGGRYRISIYVLGKLFNTNTLYLDKPIVITFRIDKLVVVGGYRLQTTQFLASILLGILVIVFALALIYRRLRRRKVHHGEKEKSL